MSTKVNMWSNIILCVVLLVIMITEVWTQPKDSVVHFKLDTEVHALQTQFKPEHRDRGYFTNCGSGGGYFNLSWFPKDLSPIHQVEVFADIVAPIDIDSGRLSAGIWYEESPLMSMQDIEFSCDELNQQLNNRLPQLHVPHVNCPIHTGQRLVGYFLYTETQKLIDFEGTYKLKAELKTEEGRQLLCAEADVNIGGTVDPL